MPRAAWITGLASLAAVGAAAGTAAARPPPDDDYLERPIVIAADPVPEPKPEPPPPPRRATIALASAGMSYASDTLTPLERFGPVGTMGILHLSHRDEPGFEAVAGAAAGPRGRSYAASVRLVVGSRLRRADPIAPFLALGASFAIARLDEGAGKDAGAGLGIGPSGAIGLHGFVSHRLYWRASAGFVGAGIGTFSTDLGLGWVVGK